MKQVESCITSLEIPEATDQMAVLKHLERIGRICYKSEDKITDESCVKFIQNLFNRKHWAMLEHYIFVMVVPKDVFEDITDRRWMTAENVDAINYMRFIHPTYWKDANMGELKYLVSGSATAFNYLQACECFNKEWEYDCGVQKIYHYMSSMVPHLMGNTYDARTNHGGIRFLSREEISALPRELKLIHDFRSVKITTDRGVTHELVRHRPASWAQESTRYCNYSKDKFGGELSVLDPFFYQQDSRSQEYDVWKAAMKFDEACYNKLIQLGSTAQEARTVLPHSTKVDIVITAPLMEFRHFFKMRVPMSAHPQMREVAIPMLHHFRNDENIVDVFGDLVCDGMDDDLHIIEEDNCNV